MPQFDTGMAELLPQELLYAYNGVADRIDAATAALPDIRDLHVRDVLRAGIKQFEMQQQALYEQLQKTPQGRSYFPADFPGPKVNNNAVS